MSLSRKVHFPCPKCNTTMDATVWDSVNTGLMQDLPKRIISGEFFDHVCPTCGFVCHMEYPLLYHDMEKNIMIWVVYKDEDYHDRVQEIRNADLAKGYLSRIVHTVDELREKVCILEAGYDDRVVEIYKYLQLSHYQQIEPHLNVEKVFFVYEGERSEMILGCRGGELQTSPFRAEDYECLAQILEPVFSSISSIPFALVELTWAKSVFLSHCGDVVEEAKQCGLTIWQMLVMQVAKRKREQTPDSGEKPVSSQSGNEGAIKFCRKCGEKLLGDSLFCHKCGTKVGVEELAAQQIQSEPRSEKASSPQHELRMQDKPKTQPVEKGTKTSGMPLWKKCLPIAMLVLAALAFFNWDQLRMLMFCDIRVMDNQDIMMTVGDTYMINYQADIEDFPASVIEWESHDPAVAEVSETGVITAKGEGHAFITVSLNGRFKGSCNVVVSLKPVAVENGEMIITPQRTGQPEITVHAPSDKDCFVYFKHWSSRAFDLGFYVTAGSSVTVNVLAGSYQLYYATGETWYGKDLKFGLDSTFYHSPDTIHLSEDREVYDVIDITLYTVPDGNMETQSIDESEFPV